MTYFTSWDANLRPRLVSLGLEDLGWDWGEKDEENERTFHFRTSKRVSCDREKFVNMGQGRYVILRRGRP